MRLGHADLEAILAFLARVDDLDADEPYAAELLASLQSLIPCDSLGYHSTA